MIINLNRIKPNNFYQAQNPSGRKYPNLAPLAHDTISFGSTNPQARTSAKKNVFSSPQNTQVCNTVRKNAEPARYYLEEMMKYYLKPILSEYPADKKPFNIITNIKSSNSIKQKIIYKLPEKIEKEGHEFARMAIKQLIKVYECKPNIKESELYNIVINNAEYKAAAREFCAFQSVSKMLQIAVDALSNSGAMKFDNDIKNDKKKFKRIVQYLSSKTPDYSNDNFEILGTSDANARVKNFIHDIVRGRIVLNENNPNLTKKILNAFKNMLKDGNVKIKSIEYIMPDRNKITSEHNVDECMPITFNDLYEKFSDSDVQLIKRTSESGYSAIHINLELSNKLFANGNDNYNGYSAEIQIMSSHVQDLKEIEDLLYKFGDSIPLADKEYKPMAELFKSKLTPEVQKAFDEYRYKLYIRQMTNPINGKKNLFPSIKDMGFEGKIPPELDFNYLKQFKDICDDKIKLNEKEQKLKEKYNVKKNDDYAIDTMKKVIKSVINGGVKDLALDTN